jgi:hypothetical protein
MSKFTEGFPNILSTLNAITDGFKLAPLLRIIAWLTVFSFIIFYAINLSSNYFEYYKIEKEIELINKLNLNSPTDSVIKNKSLLLKYELLNKLDNPDSFYKVVNYVADFPHWLKLTFGFIILNFISLIMIIVEMVRKKFSSNNFKGGIILIVLYSIIYLIIPQIYDPISDSFFLTIALWSLLIIFGLILTKLKK